MRIRILNSNTHAGQGLREGGLKRCAAELDVDIITVQEVQRAGARARLRKQFPPNKWGIHGFWPPSVGPQSAGNHVLWQKSLFKKVGSKRGLISPQLYVNGRRDKWHPSRREGQVRLEARDNGKRLAVSSDHTWSTGGHDWSSPDRVVHGHKHQCRRYAENAWDAQAAHFCAVNCGDYNARVAPGDSHTAYIEAQMADHSMVPARPANAQRWSLDAAFVSEDVEVVSFDWIPERLLTTDHDGFLLVVKI